MSSQPSEPLVFLSHAKADAEYANRMEKILLGLGIRSWNFNTAVLPGDNYLEKVQPVLNGCSHIMVLLGPTTQFSRFVDIEMDLAMAPRLVGDGNAAQPGAALLGVKLPNHEDFSKPYYEPDRVPGRLHDFIAQNMAILKKWTEEASAIPVWLEEAALRRQRYRQRWFPPPSTLSRVQSMKDWSEDADRDEVRDSLRTLSPQHFRTP